LACSALSKEILQLRHVAGKLQSDPSMKRRAYLRTVTMAVPGLLLSGWAPARAAVRPVHLLVSDIADGEDAQALRQGVELGLDEIGRAAEVVGVPLVVHRANGARAGRAIPCSGTAVQVVIAAEDDLQSADGATPCGPRIYTCPLRQWRPDAWSVASRQEAAPRQLRQLRLDWHPTLDTPGAAQLSARFHRRTGTPMGEAAWRGWMAVKAAFEIALRTEAGEDDLLVLQLDGHKGQSLRFSEDGHLVQPTCRLVAGRAALTPPVDYDLLTEAD
jgi:hypothetical protein